MNDKAYAAAVRQALGLPQTQSTITDMVRVTSALEENELMLARAERDFLDAELQKEQARSTRFLILAALGWCLFLFYAFFWRR